MSELSDLEPKPAGALLTFGQVALYLKAHNAERPCEACGSSGWAMLPEQPGSFGLNFGVVVMACRICNAVRWFLRPAILKWVRDNRA